MAGELNLTQLGINELYAMLADDGINNDEWFRVSAEIETRELTTEESGASGDPVDEVFADHDEVVDGMEIGSGTGTSSYGSVGSGKYGGSYGGGAVERRRRLIEDDDKLTDAQRHVVDLARERKLYVLEGTFTPYYRGGIIPQWYLLESTYVNAMQVLLDDDSLSIRDFADGRPLLRKGMLLEVEGYRPPVYAKGTYTPDKTTTTTAVKSKTGTV